MLKNICEGQLYFYKRKLQQASSLPNNFMPLSTIFVETKKSISKPAYLPAGKHLVLALCNLVRLPENSLSDDYAWVRVLFTSPEGNKKIIRVVINYGRRVNEIFDGPL